MTKTKLNLEELDNVTGGNPDEFNQLGTGFNARPNRYTDKATGRTLTHPEVLSIIQARG